MTTMPSMKQYSHPFSHFSVESHWSPAIEHRTVTAGGQSIDCAIANIAHPRSNYQNYENAQKNEQCSFTGTDIHTTY